MKTKIVTIHNWDGSKYDVEAPEKAKYIGIYCNTGHICFYGRKPRVGHMGYGDMEDIIRWPTGTCYASPTCPEDNLPMHDGYGRDGMPYELILKIEEA